LSKPDYLTDQFAVNLYERVATQRHKNIWKKARKNIWKTSFSDDSETFQSTLVILICNLLSHLIKLCID